MDLDVLLDEDAEGDLEDDEVSDLRREARLFWRRVIWLDRAVNSAYVGRVFGVCLFLVDDGGIFADVMGKCNGRSIVFDYLLISKRCLFNDWDMSLALNWP